MDLVETLGIAATRRDDPRALPTALVLPAGCCADEGRWFDRVEWHDIKPGTRGFSWARPPTPISGRWCAQPMSGFQTMRRAGIAYHF